MKQLNVQKQSSMENQLLIKQEQMFFFIVKFARIRFKVQTLLGYYENSKELHVMYL